MCMECYAVTIWCMLVFVHLADKEAHVRSEDYGRDLSSVQTLLTKQVKLVVFAFVYFM